MTKSEANLAGETSTKTKRTPLGKGFRNLFVSTTVAAFGGSVSTVAVSYIVYHVNYQWLKHIGLYFQICWHGNPFQERSTIGQLTSGNNPYQSCRMMVWPSPFGQRHMLYSPRCHHRIPQATLSLIHASYGAFQKEMRIQYIWVSQFLPRLKPWASLRLDGEPSTSAVSLWHKPS